MALSIFEDKLKIPNNQELQKVLAEKYQLWNEIESFVLQEYPSTIREWNYSGKNYGWGYRLKDKKRAIIYLTPSDGFFRIAIVFGEKATKEAILSSISQEIKDIISSAKVYAEGRGFIVDITNKELIEDIKTLIKIKLSN